MLNSLLMLGSTSKKMGKINFLCVIMWIGYMLMNANLETGLFFAIVNLIVFLITFGLSKIVKGKLANSAVAVFSILIWSILIDTITFFMYPQFTMGQNIVGYIFNGIVFNAKYVLSNIIVLCLVYGCDFMMNKIKFLSRKENAKLVVSSLS